MNDVVDTVRDQIHRAIDEDALVLPTLPEVALQVREVAEDPDADIDRLAKVIGNDAALSARIIKVANSPLLRASKKIEDLKMALMRLGIEYTCNLATGLAMEQMFQATSDLVDKRLRDVWSRTSEIAGIAHVLCKHYTKLRPDQATLAGLVCNIGMLPILTYAEEHPRLLFNSIVLDEVIENLHPELGDRILSHWGFHDELAHVPSEHLNFDRKVAAADYSDIVMVAKLQTYVGSEHPYAEMDWHKISAFQRLGLDPDVQCTEAEDLSDEMEAAMELLK